MGEAFDPYYKWLAIPHNEQPPNLYRLLGIRLFESDGDVITNAADQRMALLKRFESGRHSAQSQQLLNQVAVAKLCLLNPKKKAAYDAALRQQLAETGPMAPPPPPPAAPEPTPPPTVEVPPPPPEPAATRYVEPPPQDASSCATHTTVHQDGCAPVREGSLVSTFVRQWGTVAVLGVLALALAVMIAVLATRKGNGTAKVDEGEPEVVDRSTNSAEGNGSFQSPTPLEPEASAARQQPKQPGVPPEPKDKTEPSDPDALGPEKQPPAESAPPPEEPVSPPAEPPARASVPDDQAQSRARQAIADAYGERIDAAKTPQQRSALSQQLFDDAVATEADPAGRYVLAKMACDMAAEAGAAAWALERCDGIAEWFKVDAFALKSEVMVKAAQAAGAGPASILSGPEYVDMGLDLLDEALQDDRYDRAEHFADLALRGARRLNDRQLEAEIGRRKAAVARHRRAFEALSRALATLEDEPDDPSANLIAGRWFGFRKGDWDRALSHLAKGSDEKLAEPARRDLAQPEEPQAQMCLGDAWWELAGKEAEPARSHLLDRAALWYRRALHGLEGIDQRKVEMRLDEVEGKQAGHVLVFDGQQSWVGVPRFFYNGAFPITIEAYVVPTDGTGTRTVVGNGEDAGLRLGMQGGRWDFEIYELVPGRAARVGAAQPRQAVSINPVEVGRRVHLAAVYDGVQIGLFVDGRREAVTRMTGRHKPAPYPLVIGAGPQLVSGNAAPAVHNHFAGVIEAVRISRGARYANQDFAPPGQLRADANTILMLPFDRGEGDVVQDRSAGKHGARIMGARWEDAATWRRQNPIPGDPQASVTEPPLHRPQEGAETRATVPASRRLVDRRGLVFLGDDG